jgi:streptogramin lyase
MRPFRAACLLATALFALGSATASASSTVTEYSTGLTSGSSPWGITAGPDGNLWFTETSAAAIGRVTTSGTITEFPGLTLGSSPRGITAGPDGNLWFAESGGLGAIGRISTSGAVTEFTSGLTTLSQPEDIAAGPDGNLWFTEKAVPGRIGRITPAGVINEFSAGLTIGSQPESIVAGPDGNLWFTETANPGRIGRITTAGVITEFSTGLTANSAPNQIVAGPDGNLWFTELNNPGRIGRITTSGTVSEFSVGLTPNLQPAGIATAGDGSLWFTESASPGQLGRVTVLGGITEYSSGLTAASTPLRATGGPDGNVWFTENANPGRIGLLTVPPGASTAAATGVADHSATFHASVRPNSQATNYYFEYAVTTAYGATSSAGSAGSGAGPQPLVLGLSGLTAGTLYHYRVVATNGSGTSVGSDQTFTTTGTAPPPPPPGGGGSTTGSSGSGASGTPPNSDPFPQGDPLATLASAPVLGGSVVLAPTAGQVLIKPKGAKRFVPLTAGILVPVGSVVDTTRGTVKLTSARGGRGKTQTGEFHDGVFEIRQQKKGDGYTDLILRGGDFKSCGKVTRRAFAVARMARKAKRKLSGKDKGGRFRTRGRYGSATVRGTEWLTADYCDGTLVSVHTGSVAVRDKARKKTILVTAGKSYFIRARSSSKHR